MKYLYILVDSESGFYTKQTYVSMLSLKHVSPNAQISLLVDDETDMNNKSSFFAQLKQIANEYKSIPLDKSIPPVAKSRFLKTTMRQNIEGDFLYIDSDTIWANPIQETDFSFDIMGVLDQHVTFSKKKSTDAFIKLFTETDCFPETEYFINGGVLFSRDSDFSKSFFEQWHEKWIQTSKSGIFVDQPSLNYVISKNISNKDFLLPGEYNCQISNSWDFFFKAKIIHYFSSCSLEDSVFGSPYILQQQSFWKQFEANLTESYLERIITSPLTLFEEGIMIKSAAERNFEETKIFGFAKDIYARKMQGKKSRFDLIEKILTHFIKKNK